MSKKQSRCRNSCFTIHDYEIEQIENLKANFEKGKISYMILGFETGEGGSEHIQGYMEFTNQVCFSTINKMLAYVVNPDKDWPHNEPRKKNSTQKQAIDYCKKGEQSKDEWNELKQKGPNFGLNAVFKEYGTPKPGQGSRTDMDLARQWMKEGKTYKWICDNCDNLQVLKFVKDHIHMYEPTKQKQPLVYWFYGPSGCSKSFTAKAQIGPQSDESFYKPNLDQWWEGYDGHKKVLMDELRPDHMPAAKLLNLLGPEPDLVNQKYGKRQFRAEEIWITTSKHPKEFYADYVKDGKEDVNQFLRRISKITYFNKVYETVSFEPIESSQDDEMKIAKEISENRLKSKVIEESKDTQNFSEVAGNNHTATDYKCPLSLDQKNIANKKFDEILRKLENKNSEMSETISEILEDNARSSEETREKFCLKCNNIFEPMMKEHYLCEECYLNVTCPKLYKKEYNYYER